jgi:hypothetical protein
MNQGFWIRHTLKSCVLRSSDDIEFFQLRGELDGVQDRDRSLHRQDEPSRLDQKLGFKDTLDHNLLTFNARYTLRQRT